MNYEENYVEPETAISFGDNFKVETKLLLNVEELESAMWNYCHTRFKERMEQMAKDHTERAFKNAYNTTGFDEMLKRVITEKLDSTYPDLVENKVNELADKIKNMKIEDHRNRWDQSNIVKAAQKTVMDYIDNELKSVVSKTKEEIDDYAKNYFARNLFKAMNFMDGVLSDKKQIN